MKMNIFLIASIFAALSCSPTEPVTQQPQEPADPEPQPSERVLLAPGSLACSMTDAGLLLTWEDNSNREEGYIVVRQVGDGEPENIFIDANSTSYTDTGVDKGHYVYTVMSYYGMDRSDPASCEYENYSAPSVSVGNPETSWYMVSVPVILDDDGGLECSVGICWSEDGEPTLEDNVYEFRGEVYESAGCYGNVTGMAEGETYTVRAWAKNAEGTVYSSSVSVQPGSHPEPFYPEWQEIDTYDLPSSVRLYSTSTDITGRHVNAWYAVADMSAGDVELRTMKASSLKTPSQFVAEDMAGENVCVIVNGGYFDSTPQSFSYVLDRGVQQAANIKTLTRTFSYYVTRGAFGVSRDGKPSIRWIYNSGDTPWTYGRPLPVVDGENTLTPTAFYPEQSSDWDVYSAIGGAPVILRDGKICFDYLTTASGKYKTNHELLQNDIFGPSVRPPRTAIGYTAEGNIVLMVVDGRNAGGSQGVTLDELARLMAGVGCTDALNLDGGGSTAMCVTPSAVLLNSHSDGSQRKVMSFVSFVSK